MMWHKIKDESPAPHTRYLVMRDGVIYTATPCYGLHDPWWVGRVLGGFESAPITMLPTDEWCEVGKLDALERELESANWRARSRERLIEAAIDAYRGEYVTILQHNLVNATRTYLNSRGEKNG